MILYDIYNLHYTLTLVGNENRVPLHDQMIVSVATLCSLALPVRHIDILSPLKQGGIENNHKSDTTLHQFGNIYLIRSMINNFRFWCRSLQEIADFVFDKPDNNEIAPRLKEQSTKVTWYYKKYI